MPDLLVDHAGTIALACALLSAVAAGIGAWFAWREWRRVSTTHAAAMALLDVHVARLETSIDEASAGADRFAQDGEQLADSLAELRANTSHLRWIIDRVPTERARLLRELGNLVLPTDDEPRGERVRGT
jgi:hypothetical protein